MGLVRTTGRSYGLCMHNATHPIRKADHIDYQRLRRYFPQARVDKDPTAPLLWAVWDGDDLVGAGHTEYQAIRDAITTARGWRK